MITTIACLPRTGSTMLINLLHAYYKAKYNDDESGVCHFQHMAMILEHKQRNKEKDYLDKLLEYIGSFPKDYVGIYELHDIHFINEAVKYLKQNNKHSLFKSMYTSYHMSVPVSNLDYSIFDKVIILDRKDKEALMYSLYMSGITGNFHDAIDPTLWAMNTFPFEKQKFEEFKKVLNYVLNDKWPKEKDRLLKEGAIEVWYEDIKDMTGEQILEHVGIKDHKEYLDQYKINTEIVWSSDNLK